MVARCLSKDRERRPASARDLAGELAEISFHLQSGEPLALEPSASTVEIVAEPLERAAESASVFATADQREGERSAETVVRTGPSAAARRRRAVAWVALTAAAVTWLAPASSLLHVQPAMVNAGSWVSALVTGASWSRLVPPSRSFE